MSSPKEIIDQVLFDNHLCDDPWNDQRKPALAILSALEREGWKLARDRPSRDETMDYIHSFKPAEDAAPSWGKQDEAETKNPAGG